MDATTTRPIGRPTIGKRYLGMPGLHGFRTVTNNKTGESYRKYVVELTICEGQFSGQTVEYVGGLEGDGLDYTLADLAKMGMAADCLDPSDATLDQKVQFKLDLSKNGEYEQVKFIERPASVGKAVDEGFREALKRQIAAKRGLAVTEPQDDGVPF